MSTSPHIANPRAGSQFSAVSCSFLNASIHFLWTLNYAMTEYRVILLTANFSICSTLDFFSEVEVPEEEAEALLKELDADVFDEPFMPGSDDEFSDCEGPIAEESDEGIEGRGSTPTCKLFLLLVHRLLPYNEMLSAHSGGEQTDNYTVELYELL